MLQLLLVLHVLVSIGLIALVLMQHGKGADVGANFGGGSSQTFFGSQGPASFLMKFTSTLAAVFFATSLCLSYFIVHANKPSSQMILPIDNAPTTQKQPVQQPNPS